MLDVTPMLTRMFLQLHACEPYRNSYTVVEPHADNPELLYLPSTKTRVLMCIKTHSSVNDNAATAVLLTTTSMLGIFNMHYHKDTKTYGTAFVTPVAITG